jgi:hypothetical protein
MSKPLSTEERHKLIQRYQKHIQRLINAEIMRRGGKVTEEEYGWIVTEISANFKEEDLLHDGEINDDNEE